MPESWFITIDDPKIKIRHHIKKQFMNINVDGFIDESNSDHDFDETTNYLVLSKKQYLEEDDKWILSLSQHLLDKGNYSLKNKNYNDSIEDYLDSLCLQKIQREKYISEQKTDLLKKCGQFINSCEYYICRSSACLIFSTIPTLDMKQFENALLSKLKEIDFPKLNYDKVIKVFISGIKYFEYQIDVFEYWDIINKLSKSDFREVAIDIRDYLDNRKKLLRKTTFDKKSIKPAFDKIKLKELSFCHHCLSKIFEITKDIKYVKIELAEGFKYNAYMADDVEEVIENFDKSIKLLENVAHNYPDENGDREVLFAKARKAEHLAFCYKDLNSRIKHLKLAYNYYRSLNNSRSYLAKFLSSYYQMKKYIVEESKFQLGIESTREITKNQNNIDKLIDRYPDVHPLYFTCLLIELFPIKPPKELEIKKINDMQYNITIGLQRLKPLWEIIYAYSLLLRSVGDNPGLNKLFRETIKTFLQSGTTLELEEVAGRLFYAETTEKVSQEFIEYLRKDEGQNVEFKASFSIDIRAFLFSGKTIDNKILKEDVLKAIVGFLNSSGGSLILGVLEKRNDFLQFKDQLDEKFNKYIVGVEREYKNDGYDGYIRRIEDILRERVDSNLSSLLKINKYSLSGHDLIHFIIPRADKWYYLDNEAFYVREHNQTINKKGADADEYKSKNPR